MTFPGLGGQQPPPQNASPAGQLVPGVQAGVSGQIVARRVIIIGTGGELLVYSPTAGAGNLVASIAGSVTTDAYGNTVQAGITSYTGTSYVQMLADDINFVVPGLFQAQQLLATGNAVTALSSGLQSGADVAASVVALSQAANSGASGINLNAAMTTTSANMTVDGSLTINISLNVINGATVTGGLTVDTINGSADTGTPIGTGFFNTTGLASGSYGSTHQHTLPNFPTATHTHPV